MIIFSTHNNKNRFLMRPNLPGEALLYNRPRSEKQETFLSCLEIVFLL